MASEELARKLQSRLSATQEAVPRPEPEQSPVRPKPQGSDAACGDSSSELSAKLTRRLDINEGNAAPRATRVFNPYTEFKEFSHCTNCLFCLFKHGSHGCCSQSQRMGANERARLDHEISQGFLLIFRRAAAGELQEESGLMALARLSEIDVSTQGVMGAKDFFEAKMQALSAGSKFEAEIREEKEERKRQEEEKKQRHAAFKQLQSTFCS
uniref:EF-hand domain family, member D1 n=1 Tax=Pundamilia nyererei TaxID=303518 RepID=A0A3B4GSC8_9CICH